MPQRVRIWHAQEEKVLKEYAEICNTYAWLHSKAEERLSAWSHSLIIPAITINGLIAALSFASSASGTSMSFSIAVGIMNVIAGSLTLVEHTLGFTLDVDKHRECAIVFGKIGRQISNELSLPKRDRTMDGCDFVRYASSEADRCLQMYVSIPDTIMRRYSKEFGRSAKTLREVTIFTEPITSSSSSSSTSSSSSSSTSSSSSSTINDSDPELAIEPLSSDLRNLRKSVEQLAENLNKTPQ